VIDLRSSSSVPSLSGVANIIQTQEGSENDLGDRCVIKQERRVKYSGFERLINSPALDV
jgi:hypothetical protein